MSLSVQEAKIRQFGEVADHYIEQLHFLQKEGLVCLDGDFVPSVHYPPITQYDPGDDESILKTFTLAEDGATDLYVHFPFCIQHCTFCHYPGLVGPQHTEKGKYLSYLEREMDIYLHRLGIKQFKPRSILLGGGTPTFMTPKQLEHFLKFFSARIDPSMLKQYNVDVDPNSLIGPEGLERLQIMKDYGVTRLTIGVQSFNDDILRRMNRPHTVHEAIESIENTVHFGFKLNIEFIFGYPGQTIENWLDTIDLACHMPTDEIQLYRLKVLAYGDRQGHILQERMIDPASIPDFDTTMRMKSTAISLLNEYGFQENLRRVYTKKKENISHYAYNQCCNLYDQIGFGLTAFSSLRDRFTINTQHFKDYYDMIDSGHLPVNRGYIRDREQQMRWSIALPMKNTWLIKKKFESINGLSFDTVFPKKVARLKEYGLIEDKGAKVELTDIGKFVADEVVEQFNSCEYLPFPRSAYSDGPLNPYNDNTTEDAFGRI
jgi:oxygen-independent coproporphyrinogen-3 oxidase